MCVCVVSDTVLVVWVGLGQTVPFPTFPTWILLPYLVAGGGTTSRAAQLGSAVLCHFLSPPQPIWTQYQVPVSTVVNQKG